MTGPLRWFRALPLRTRLAMLVATAVAVAVAAVAASCWFVTKAQLDEQMDDSLRRSKVDSNYLASLYAYCRGATPLPPRPFSGAYTVQLIDSQGTVCIAPKISPLPVSSADIAVTEGEQDYALHSATAENGTKMRVFTYPLVQLAQPPATRRATSRSPSPVRRARSTTRSPPLPGSSSSSPASASSVRVRPASGSPAPVCAPSTNSPTPSSMSPAPRTSHSASRSRARTRSPGFPTPSTR